MNISIYLTKDELREATEAYLIENHQEFYGKFTEAKWTAYYNSNFQLELIKF